jgi:hypothetical protein
MKKREKQFRDKQFQKTKDGKLSEIYFSFTI